MKSLLAILATAFALSAMAADAPKTEVKPAQVTASKPAKTEVKHAKADTAKPAASAPAAK